MSADFWAGYISGAVGIVIGNPLDLIKVRLQARDALAAQTPSAYFRQFENTAALVSGTAAPILGYGALNALLFVSYNRTEAALNAALGTSGTGNLWTTWAAGAVGGLATWVVSTPTELIKCRAQLASPPQSSWAIARQTLRNEGIRGLYFGGVVTALRDSIGYGFYFWSYELTTRWMAADVGKETSAHQEAAKVLLCGGIAGIVTWASVFPLDVIKTRVQAQTLDAVAATTPETTRLLGEEAQPVRRKGAMEIARQAYREEGARVFFRGLTICSVRAFMVNAVQWAVYEYVMREMGQGRKREPLDSRVEMIP
ncbi:solute carrier family 25 member 45 [Plectosphaerella plurivora]|uniref:Solute carrier family 25 member 45 n=1 Tax=Plectosphaerella plurivora TaxID=936078 RepID=A0A9P8V369_9PEZI|nr:solute carrier family 25 member 45 [Plectosphaerella plurivora]